MSKKTLFYILFMHILFFILAISFLIYQREKEINNYLTELYKTHKVVFKKSIDVLNKNIDLLENLLISKDIVKLIAQAENNASVRSELIKKFLPKYEILKRNGYYLVHFHLKGGISFVRFHRLDKFGDELYSFRPAIKYVQENNVTFHGFEIGKGVGGFRSIYPLIWENRVVGSFEVAFSMRNLIKHMFMNEHLSLVIKKDLLNSLAYKSAIKNFEVCKLNSNYYTWGNGCELFKNYHNINFDKKIAVVEENIVLAYPIFDFRKIKEGYIIFVIPKKSLTILNEINKNFNSLILIVNVLFFVILFIIFGAYFYFEIKRKAEIDYLTQTFNRNGCIKRVKSLKNYSLLVIDVDFFKKINDTYGHDVGDKILKEVVRIIKSSIRDEDVLCRWGGEEFVVVLKNTKIYKAREIAEKIRERIANENFDGVKVSVSIGVSGFKGSFEKTFKAADEKLYIAKNSGRNRVV